MKRKPLSMKKLYEYSQLFIIDLAVKKELTIEEAFKNRSLEAKRNTLLGFFDYIWKNPK